MSAACLLSYIGNSYCFLRSHLVTVRSSQEGQSLNDHFFLLENLSLFFFFHSIGLFTKFHLGFFRAAGAKKKEG